MSPLIVPVIIAGGAGTRLWPLSTPEKPKPFHALVSERTLFQDTVLRFAGTIKGFTFTPPMVICGHAHRELVETQLAAIGQTATIVLEPQGRGTALAAAVGVGLVGRIRPGAVVLLTPADHHIADRAAFQHAIAVAAPVAFERLITFGVPPTGPSTGYGYIEAGAHLATGVREVTRFVEKPDQRTAEGYLAAGGYLWNSGAFLLSPPLLAEELAALAPEVARAAAQALNGAQTGQTITLNDDAYARCPNISLDVAVMEQTRRAAVAPADMGWADVGDWSEVWRITQPEAESLIITDGVPAVLESSPGMIIVATRQGVLVIPRERAQDVGRLSKGSLRAAR